MVTKQMEIPENWSMVECNLLCTKIIVGIVVKPASYYVKSGIPALRNLNIKENRVDMNNLVHISQEDNNTILKKSKLQEGDVVVTRTGNPGIACVIPKELDGVNCIDLLIAKPKENIITSLFLSYFLNSSLSKRQIFASKTGLAQQHLNVKALKELNIILPPILEQQAISSILSSVDSVIQHTQRLIDYLQLLKKGLMQQLFTQGIEHIEFKETKIGTIPKEWEIARLGDLINYSKGKKPSITSNIYDKEYLLYLSTEYLRYGKIETYVHLQNDEVCANDEDLLLIWDGSNAGEFFYGRKGVVSSTMIKFKSTSSRVLQKFLYYFCKSTERELRRQTIGTGIPHVDKFVF